MLKLRKNIAISDTGYVFDPSTGESYTLNPVGLEIVQLLKQNLTEEDIKKLVLQRYEVDEATLERYYLDFLGMLKSYNLAGDE